ncbi:MAG: 5'/3'-nucleotidase SurE [Alphaproteobacteria bacterium]|nr:5'/3'-nucleotidase SurE [Alphaproteobacteria bacterium]
MTAIDLSTARILVTNDDGIQAPGIKVLEKVARSLCKDVWTVAPEEEHSGAGHSLTLRYPLRIRQVSRRRYAVDGTPTDAVLLGVRVLLKSKRPTLVLSGVNRGGNLGEDVTYSGTVAAAMEGTQLGIPSIALSQCVRAGHPVHWAATEQHAADVIRKVCAVGWPKNVLINLNFPPCPGASVVGVQATAQGRHKIGGALQEGRDPRGNVYYWIATTRDEDEAVEGTDLAAVRGNIISVTPLFLDLTHRPTLKPLAEIFR